MCFSSELGNHLLEELNRARPYALSLEQLLKGIKGNWTFSDVVSSLMVMYLNQYIKLSIDGYGEREPSQSSAQNTDPTHEAFRPRLNPINLSFIAEGRTGILYNRWHEYSTRVSGHQYTPLADLFDGTRTLSELVEALPEHPKYRELRLGERSREQQKDLLFELIKLFYQAGFLEEE